jgi:hypothetical protein
LLFSALAARQRGTIHAPDERQMVRLACPGGGGQKPSQIDRKADATDGVFLENASNEFFLLRKDLDHGGFVVPGRRFCIRS